MKRFSELWHHGLSGMLGAGVFSSLTAISGFAYAQGESACGVLAGDRPHYGPIDYRKASKQSFRLVEDAHFTPEVESLVRGKTGPFGGDIGYTLRVFPNHPRALISMRKLAAREKVEKPNGAEFTVACYFDRAIRYAPDDLIVRMLFADYQISKGLSTEAAQQLEWVLTQAGDNPFTYFNVGLLFFDMKSYDRALFAAHTAQALGFNRPELMEKLKEAGKWVEPTPGRGAKAP